MVGMGTMVVLGAAAAVFYHSGRQARWGRQISRHDAYDPRCPTNVESQQ
jgi:hypothetical protein